MPDASLLIARLLKLLAEIALFAWLGQFLLGALLGPARHRNVVHGLFQVVLRPVRWLAEQRLPGRWPLRWRRAASWGLVVAVWAGALAWKVHLCLGTVRC